MSTPAVSIVTATYNRARVLRHTIESALASTVTDFEMIVVGDACTDDTADVVAGFGDPRLTFVNLPANCGEQSGPNNAGMQLARAPYVALLNHDDLWTPDHLAIGLRRLQETQADLVFTMTIVKNHLGQTRLAGVASDDGYDGRCFAPASSWIFRRGLFESVGPWAPARSLHQAPSSDWLRRVDHAGKHIAAITDVTVIAILSGGRRGSYAGRHDAEHVEMARRLREDPDCVRREIIAVASELTRQDRQGVWHHLAWAGRNAVWPVMEALGVQPQAIRHGLRYRRRGGFIDHLRRTRGLSPLPREDA